MKNDLPSSWDLLLDRLMASPIPLRLHDFTSDDRITLSPASIHRNLMAMVDAGLIQREGERKQAVYSPIEHVEVTWTAKFPDRWRRMAWRTEPPIDWRYPLVGRIKDRQARGVIIRFLEALEGAGLTRPRNLGNHSGFTVIAYGSCARGDMRPDSDVDLFVVAPSALPEKGRQDPEEISRRKPELPLDYRESIMDIAADISLGAPRVLDITFAGRGPSGFTVPSALRKGICKDGVTVYTTHGSEEFVEGWPESTWDVR